MAEIDELKIVVDADTKAAVSAYARLNTAMKGFRENMEANANALTKTASALNNFAGHIKKSANELQPVAKAIRGIGNSLKALSTNAQSNYQALDELSRRINKFSNSTGLAQNNIKELANSFKTLGLGKSVSKEVESASKAVEAVNSAIDGADAKTIEVDVESKGIEDVTNQADEATKTIDGTGQSARNLKKDLDQIGKTPSKGIPKATKSIKEVGRAAKKAGMDAKHGAKGVKKFGEQIKNIIKYRIVRRILSELSAGMKEGVENLYRYSEAMKSVDSTHAKNNLDALATTWLKIKNTLGVTLMSLVNALLPAIQTLANWFIQLANTVNQFLAALAGSATYTKAIDYQAKAFDSMAGSAKEAKKTLLGFDEINQLQDNSGGGGGANTPDYSKMFKEEAVDDNIKNFADKMRGFAEEIGKIWENIFKPLAIDVGDFFFKWDNLSDEEIATKIEEALFGLCGGIIGWSVAGGAGAIIGTIAGVALGSQISKLTFNGDKRLDDEEVAKLIATAVGALLGGATGAILCKNIRGAALGFTIGATLTSMLNTLLFNGDGKVSGDEIGKLIANAVGGMILGIAGFKVAGVKGAVIGFTIGATLTAAIQSLMFNGDGELDEEEIMKLVATALGGMVGAGIGIAVSPDKVKGATLGFTLGASVTALISNFMFDGDGSLDGGEIAKSIGLILAEAGVGIALSKLFKKLTKGTKGLSDAYQDKNRNLEKQTEDTLKETTAANGLKGIFEKLKIKTTDLSNGLSGLTGVLGALGLGMLTGQQSVDNFNSKIDKFRDKLGEGKDALNDTFGQHTLNKIETFSQNSGNTIHEWSKNAVDDIRTVQGALTDLYSTQSSVGSTGSSKTGSSKNGSSGSNSSSAGMPTNLPKLDFSSSSSSNTSSNKNTTSNTKTNTGLKSKAGMPSNLTSSSKKETTTTKKNNTKTSTNAPKDNQGISGLQNLAQTKYNELNSKTVLQLGNALKNAGYQSLVTSLSKQYKGDALKAALVNLAYAKFYTNLGVSATTLSGYGDNVNKMMKSIKASATTLPSDMSKWKWNDWLKVIKGIFSTGLSVSGSSSGGGSNIIQFPTIKAAAVGGVFKSGDLILANEAGPELVGQMGTNTVVANNNQIIDGIKRGVFEAMASVMSQNRQPQTIENVFQVDSETLYRAVRKGEQKYNGRYTTAMVF